jgi:hypothetical protein
MTSTSPAEALTVDASRIRQQHFESVEDAGEI